MTAMYFQSARLRGVDMSDAARAEIVLWLGSIGLDPNEIALDLALLYDGPKLQLHATRYLTDKNGRRYFADYATERVATEPVIVDLAVDPTPEYVRALPISVQARVQEQHDRDLYDARENAISWLRQELVAGPQALDPVDVTLIRLRLRALGVSNHDVDRILEQREQPRQGDVGE